MFYQQGDVLIIKKENIDLTKGKKLNHRTLAEGEATGHSHQSDMNSELIQLDNDDIYLNVFGERSIISHQEHKEIEVLNGVYLINIVKEYDHFLEESRKVID